MSGLNLDLHALQREFRSPQFIVSESRILENLGHFTRLTGTTNRVFFPVKANPALAVLQILARNGVGEDCASAHEVYLATLVGIPFERVLYTTPATDLDYALRLLRAGASVVIDHIADLLELDALLRPLNETLPGKILVRLNPDFSIRYDQTADHQEMTAHAAVSSKFGIPSEDLLEVMAKVQLRISGLHLHVGTQMDTLKPFLDALAHLHALADELRAVGHPIELLDLGGGLGIPFGKEDRFPTLSEFVSALVPHQRPDTYRYAVEPGHALIGNAVSLLLTLEKIKASRGKRWGVTNVGTDSLAKVTLLRWQHRVFHAQGELPWQGPDVLAGPLCFAGDVLLHETALDGLQVSDPLLVTTVGAYCGALSNRFNGRLAPGVLIHTLDGKIAIAHSPENPLLDPNLQSFQWGVFNSTAAPTSASRESSAGTSR